MKIGMGEPTLASNLADLLRTAREVRATPLAVLTNASLLPDEIQLNTPLRPSATPPLSPDAMAGIARIFESLPAFQVYPWHRPALAPLDASATSRRRPERDNAVAAVGR